MKVSSLVFLASLCCVSSSVSDADTQLGEARKLASEWVRTQRLISQEQNSWQEEKQHLLASISLLKEEDLDLADALSKSKKDASKSDTARSNLLKQKAELLESEFAMKEALARQEARLRELVKWLPLPLKDELSPLLRRLPADSSNTEEPMTRRLQTIIGILTQVDKFNSTVLIEEGSRTLSDGRIIQVHTLYFGLAGGFFVDTTASIAGVLVPAIGDWRVESRNDLAPELSEAVAIYNKTTSKEARFFHLPISFHSIATVNSDKGQE
jgi:hypothetical protein